MSDFRFSISDCRIEPRQRWSGRRRGGFTFTEVLFAVMLLGIGFIMVAAIFPVAIQQSQANREDAMGVIMAKRGAKIIESIGFTAYEMQRDRAPLTDTPGTPGTPEGRYDGRVHVFDDYTPLPGYVLPPGVPPEFRSPALRYSKIIGNLVDRTDPRYAWVPLGYKLGPWPTMVRAVWPTDREPVFCEVYLVGVACRNKVAYDENLDMDPRNFTFRPKPCTFFLTEGNNDADTITFTQRDDACLPAYDHPFAAEGAYVIVADDQVPDTDPKWTQANGRMYRLGVRRTEKGPGVWELAPGKDMTLLTDVNGNAILDNAAANENVPPREVGDPPSGLPAIGFMIGRAYQYPPPPSPYVSPTRPGSSPDGAAQDLFATSVIIYFPMQ